MVLPKGCDRTARLGHRLSGADLGRRPQRTRSALLRSRMSRKPLGRGSFFLVYLALAACALSCARSSDIAVSNLPPELRVPKDAVHAIARSDGKAVGVEYEIPVPYPAQNFLAEVSSHLEKRGWKAAETDLLNPSVPSSHIRGWTAFVDETVSPRVAMHQWLADWRNQKGDVVSYALRYSSLAGDATRNLPTPTNPSLHVTAFLIPAAQAQAMAAEARKLGGK